MLSDAAAALIADAIHDLAAALRGQPWIKVVPWTPCPPYVPSIPPNTWPYRPLIGDPIPGTSPSITCSAVNQADGEGLSHTD